LLGYPLPSTLGARYHSPTPRALLLRGSDMTMSRFCFPGHIFFFRPFLISLRCVTDWTCPAPIVHGVSTGVFALCPPKYSFFRHFFVTPPPSSFFCNWMFRCLSALSCLLADIHPGPPPPSSPPPSTRGIPSNIARSGPFSPGGDELFLPLSVGFRRFRTFLFRIGPIFHNGFVGCEQVPPCRDLQVQEQNLARPGICFSLPEPSDVLRKTR